ncbi:MAG: hypothetical protein A3B91_01540 [Candidatus Yanofskybacteria bacterium RIFCSPHIGHO2_02_FULL_41_29]|uniref:FAD dependent oxidoreductase domain-containing protein n=1 Tax=Candidatus Yanofskybacteria bacterium RIFCSPHIGHO2_01_FULL_41_53 TaxID=1802663 RepID=A0A1F8EFT6_9BACT|nr:MAG: hypothetical protein A2650_00960 [Candidatus Yanofskybacteria bacterium RIFCSPHIGHO2_01_FULL_41_53]OGN11052.1 MAG: hypothetical protein A3B91_01540 [Candidatus Yanofskybacteria bacterium RIFCSPHIGHO2_02_FULL_41_29]OGN19067.1 MAG: hypothetical protein A3F48_01310 [Candidatus Yanofskybacteria bacterium RIFCSPHIGHO2_12_FULL_41_9]OGN21969.1 MAG: hypothetical protein A2916_02985 [Candidatus Yanofskybacteria bacterium RIFCSPLOWO2_01_FULL_41_67]OGN30244.1 MAG: hypothetical protein A3H54_02665 
MLPKGELYFFVDLAYSMAIIGSLKRLSMSVANQIKTDLIIIGGGIMGSAVAYQAALLGVKSVILENNNLAGPHYSTNIWAPRADYMPSDIDEVERTTYECCRWLHILPECFSPQLFLILINSRTPYKYNDFRSLLRLYDRLTKERLSPFPSKSFGISEAGLRKMEPNLRVGKFDRGLGFYELVSDPKIIAKALKSRTESLVLGNKMLRIRKIAGYERNSDGMISRVIIITESDDVIVLSKSRGIPAVINATGPWINQTASDLGINFPIESHIGVQGAIFEKYCFQSNLLIFAEDGKYLIVRPYKDHVQIGPTNKFYGGTIDEFKSDKEKMEKHLSYLERNFKEIVELNYTNKDLVLKSVGARLKLKLPINSNRPFIFSENNASISNYFAVYPGKLPSALRTADELLKIVAERGLTPYSIKHFIGSTKGVLIGERRTKNSVLLWMEKIKSLFIVGINIFIDKFKSKTPRK